MVSIRKLVSFNQMLLEVIKHEGAFDQMGVGAQIDKIEIKEHPKSIPPKVSICGTAHLKDGQSHRFIAYIGMDYVKTSSGLERDVHFMVNDYRLVSFFGRITECLDGTYLATKTEAKTS